MCTGGIGGGSTACGGLAAGMSATAGVSAVSSNAAGSRASTSGTECAAAEDAHPPSSVLDSCGASGQNMLRGVALAATCACAQSPRKERNKQSITSAPATRHSDVSLALPPVCKWRSGMSIRRMDDDVENLVPLKRKTMTFDVHTSTVIVTRWVKNNSQTVYTLFMLLVVLVIVLSLAVTTASLDTIEVEELRVLGRMREAEAVLAALAQWSDSWPMLASAAANASLAQLQELHDQVENASLVVDRVASWTPPVLHIKF